MSIIEIKNKIKAIKNIGQITKAMEVVAATKMRKSQEVALRSRPYAFKALQLLSTLDEYLPSPLRTRLMEVREVKKTVVIVVTSDRGLAGAFNSQVLKATDKFLSENNKDKISVIAVGKKAAVYAHKKKLDMIKGFYGFGDFVRPDETDPFAEIISLGFVNKKWDKVITISTHFHSTIKQEVLIRQILPVDLSKIEEALDETIPKHGRFSELREVKTEKNIPHHVEYILEPSPQEIVESLVSHLVRMQIYHIVLEANASEHSARMVAMKTASDNAAELSEDLNLAYNKARQAGITKELIEITSAINTLQ